MPKKKSHQKLLRKFLESIISGSADAIRESIINYNVPRTSLLMRTLARLGKNNSDQTYSCRRE